MITVVPVFQGLHHLSFHILPMGNNTSSNAGASANVRPHGKRSTTTHRRAQQKAQTQQVATEATAAPLPQPPAPTPLRCNPQRKPSKELVRVMVTRSQCRLRNPDYVCSIM